MTAPRLSYSDDAIKARCATADLLAAVESYEALGCAFGVVANAYVRAKARDAFCKDFTCRGVVFEVEGFWNRNLILSHVAKPKDGAPGESTLRPFAELLVRYGLREARLISPNTWTAWVEVSRDGRSWRKLQNTAPVKPDAPTAVLDADIPPAPEVSDAPCTPTPTPPPAPAGAPAGRQIDRAADEGTVSV